VDKSRDGKVDHFDSCIAKKEKLNLTALHVAHNPVGHLRLLVRRCCSIKKKIAMLISSIPVGSFAILRVEFLHNDADGRVAHGVAIGIGKLGHVRLHAAQWQVRVEDV